ncbi:TonB-dependent receptor [Glacieibacterium frigidum]|uniref:TonB-dependent receptor n=1 Tax=Glacieibacterium frigidum TaxID=2593303 RepID=A0A552UAC1_9SPHN|nr:TonB-dependent receptor [Glacieibacterium frigidum]TRW15164.1 TonB-dependent receptor [Glacieibacterium frigidum]
MRATGRLLIGVAGAALSTGLHAQSTAAPAAEAASAAAPEDGEIIITARRVNEALIDVPASITAFSAATIEAKNIQKAEDFVKLTPGVTIVTGTDEAGSTQINIRGINGARDAESSVALVVDGILKTNTAQLNQKQGTLRQIEILKGPQGALYGRNAAAGAIVIQTVKPGDTFEGEGRASFGNVGTYSANAYVAGPLSDTVGFVVSGDYATTNGFYRNSFLNNRKVVDDQTSWSIDGRLVAKLGEATTLDAKARYGELDGASINFNAAFLLPNFGGAFYEDVNEHPFNSYSNIRPTNDQKTFEASLKLDHDFDFATLTVWGLYSDIKNDFVADGTSGDFARYISAAQPAGNAAVNACFASTAALTGFPVNAPGFIGQIPVPFIFAPANGSTFGPYSPTTCDGTQYQKRDQRDFSTEIRLASNGDGPLNWQVGAYYLHIDRHVGVSLGADTGNGVIKQLYNGPTTTNPTSQLFDDKFKTDVYAGFGSIDYKPTSRFDLSVALRYDIERRRADNQVPVAIDPFTGSFINPGIVGGVAIPDQKKTFKQFEPKISVRYEIFDRNNVYANYGVGFKSGGFNNQGASAIVNTNFNDGVTPGTIDADVTINDIYRKEKSDAFEAGIKGRVGPVNYSLAGYYTRIKDMQFFEFFVGSFGLLRVVSNIDRVDIKGVEANVDATILKGWSVYAAANYTDSEIKKNRSRPDTIGNESPYTSKYTINAGSQLDLPVTDSLSFLARADWRLTGPTWFHTVQNQTEPTLFSALLPISALGLPAFVGDGKFDRARRDSFSVVDLRAGIQGKSWKIVAFADNVFDKKYLAEVIPAIEFGGAFISPGARRRYGVEIGYKF